MNALSYKEEEKNLPHANVLKNATRYQGAKQTAPQGQYDTQWYTDQINRYNRQVDQNTAQQIATARADAQNKLKQAYSQNIQNQRQLAQNMAMLGIRGGASETAQLNLMNQYGANRNAVNADMTSAINSANQSAVQNKNAYALETESARRQYIENREAEARAWAREDRLRAEEQERQDADKAYERKMAERDRQEALADKAYDRKIAERDRKDARKDKAYDKKQTERAYKDTKKEKASEKRYQNYQAKYSAYYDTKKLQKALKKAKTSEEKRAIRERIGYIKQHKKKY